MNITKLSIQELRDLAARCSQRAKDLQKKTPSLQLAIEAGIRDNSYKTHRYGWVFSYSGTATVTLADGSVWECTGHRSEGTPDWLSKQGFIDFKLID